MKVIALLACLFVAPFATAQITPFEFGAAYSQSASIDLTAGGTGKLEGVEFSISQAILKLPFLGEARYGVSALFSNGEADGSLYRLFARYKSPSAGPNGLYGIVGVNWSHADPRSSSFSSKNGIGADVGGGLPMGSLFPGLPSASLEFLYHQSSEDALRGWSLGVTVRF